MQKLTTAVVMHEDGQCQTDTFSVTAQGNNAPPVICGINSGEHSKLTLHFKIEICFCAIDKKWLV